MSSANIVNLAQLSKNRSGPSSHTTQMTRKGQKIPNGKGILKDYYRIAMTGNGEEDSHLIFIPARGNKVLDYDQEFTFVKIQSNGLEQS